MRIWQCWFPETPNRSGLGFPCTYFPWGKTESTDCQDPETVWSFASCSVRLMGFGRWGDISAVGRVTACLVENCCDFHFD